MNYPTVPPNTPAHASNPTRPSGLFRPVIKVIGLGGGGVNAVNRMIELGLQGVEFIAANTDHQALRNSCAPVKVCLGPTSTRGLGAGGNPAVGQAAAEESWRELAGALRGADMVFLTAGMGGGTGTGAITIAARIARTLGAVTIAIVTTPFSFEMGRRRSNAQAGLARLRSHADTVIAIPNDRLLEVAPADLPMEQAFRLADDVLRQGVQAITDLVTTPGLINVDFANVRSLMQLGGGALMSIGCGCGENKAFDAIEQALQHPLLGPTSLMHANGLLVNITGGDDLSLFEVQHALTHLQQQTGERAELVWGVVQDQRLNGRAEVIVIVTGLGGVPLEDSLPGFRAASQAPAVHQMAAAANQPSAASGGQSGGARLDASSSGGGNNAVRSEPPTRRSASGGLLAGANRPSANALNGANRDMPAFLRQRSGVLK